MAKKLWQKSDSKLHSSIQSYTVGEDYTLDQVFLPYDLEASSAHAKMLRKIGILNASELKKIEAALLEIKALWGKGKFKIQPEEEDMHTAIENYLTKKLGDLGKKIHTGRSRNDQVLVAMHLYMKERLLEVSELIASLKKVLAAFKKKHGKTPMPGYTHMQKAMPMNIAMWIDAHTSSLDDDLEILNSALKLIDRNPLGSAAGFGINGLKLDRAYTTKLLGFKKALNPPLYCQNSRGKLASIVLNALVQVMLSLDKVANDLMLFTTSEFNFFKIDPSMKTGSSIMPQKKNLDLMEILRGDVSVVMSLESRLKSLSQGLISGYHRDFQLSKRAIFDAFSKTCWAVHVMRILFEHMSPNEDSLQAAMSDDLYATDKVYTLVSKGMTFRDAYLKVKEDL